MQIINPRVRKGSMFWHKKWLHYALIILPIGIWMLVRGILAFVGGEIAVGIFAIYIAVLLIPMSLHILYHYFRMKRNRERRQKRAAERKLRDQAEATS